MSFHEDGLATLAWVEGYLDRVGELPVLAQVEPGDVRAALPAEAPEEGESFADVLRDLDTVTPKLRDLGARHVRYGARPEHYPVVGKVLIESMAEVAGDTWTPEHELAWTAAFIVVSDAMLDGAERLECVS